ncbi:unnamed protein product [Tenebrio molitor]|nr:unnamed protein product [Tenebrio molitor]
MRSDLSEHYCCVQKGMKSHIRVIWTHKLFSNCPNLQIILRYLLCISYVSIVDKDLQNEVSD